jgi:hypothetical protein
VGFDRHRAHWDNIYYKAVKELDRLQVGPAFPPVATGRRPVPLSAPSIPADGSAELQSDAAATPSIQTQNQEIGFVSYNAPTNPHQPAADHSAAPELIESPDLASANTLECEIVELQSGPPATPSNQTANLEIGFVPQNAPPKPRQSHPKMPTLSLVSPPRPNSGPVRPRLPPSPLTRQTKAPHSAPPRRTLRRKTSNQKGKPDNWLRFVKTVGTCTPRAAAVSQTASSRPVGAAMASENSAAMPPPKQ